MPAPLAHGDAILTTAQQRLEAALGRLETADRALLELSLRQGVEDTALADLLNLDPDDLGRRRWRALERLAAELGTEPDAQLEADLVELWSGAVAPPEPLPFGEPVKPVARRSRTGRRAVAIVLVTAVAAMTVGVMIVALSDDSDDEPSRTASSPPRTSTASRTSTAPAPPAAVRLNAVGTVRGPAGSVQLEPKQRLRLSVRGLPPGQYTAWLYTSIADALPIARFGGGSYTERVQLPEEAPRFRYVDVSREPPDGNPNHSGVSMLRAPLDRVLGSA